MQASTGEEMHSSRLFALFSLFRMSFLVQPLSSIAHRPSRSMPMTMGYLLLSRSISNSVASMLSGAGISMPFCFLSLVLSSSHSMRSILLPFMKEDLIFVLGPSTSSPSTILP